MVEIHKREKFPNNPLLFFEGFPKANYSRSKHSDIRGATSISDAFILVYTFLQIFLNISKNYRL